MTTHSLTKPTNTTLRARKTHIMATTPTPTPVPQPTYSRLNQSYPITDALADFFEIPRGSKCVPFDMTSGMFTYIDTYDLREKVGGLIYFLLDEKLLKLFGTEINKYTSEIVNIRGSFAVPTTIFTKLMMRHTGRYAKT